MKTFPHGVHPSGCKSLTDKLNIREMPAPKTVYVQVAQHIGKPADPVVKAGDAVKMGQLIARAQGPVSSHIFSPCSGTVKGIEERETPGGYAPHIVIENDGEYTAQFLPKLNDPTADEIVARVIDCGIVGMGGAGFPTPVKLRPQKKVDTFIINAAECEPYITCDYRIMLEYTDQFAKGAKLLAKAMGLETVYVGIEDNKTEAINKLSQYAAQCPGLEIVPLKTKYPQGAEKQLIYAITGRKVPCGGLPADVGVSVNNVHTALSAYLAVAEGQPLYKRVMTVTGGGIKEPANLWVSVGTLYRDIIDFCGGLSDQPTVKMINGGPMMGTAVTGAACSSTKTTSCLLLMTKDEAFTGNPGPCINCGKCARACPMSLMPMYIDAYALNGDYDNSVKYGAMNCIECGCCAYVCPAKRPLVQSIRLTKKKIKERGKK